MTEGALIARVSKEQGAEHSLAYPLADDMPAVLAGTGAVLLNAKSRAEVVRSR
jgi:hypothetical protein